VSPGRSGRVWRLPVRHADLHGVGEPAAVPGAVCVHLQEAAPPQEDHHHVGQRSRARKSPAHISHGGGIVKLCYAVLTRTLTLQSVLNVTLGTI